MARPFAAEVAGAEAALIGSACEFCLQQRHAHPSTVLGELELTPRAGPTRKPA